VQVRLDLPDASDVPRAAKELLALLGADRSA
jgi:hypothetical protein